MKKRLRDILKIKRFHPIHPTAKASGLSWMKFCNLTLEAIEEALNQIFKDKPIPRFHPSLEKEVPKYLKEHIDEFYFTDYSTMTSFINLDDLKKVLNDCDNKIL